MVETINRLFTHVERKTYQGREMSRSFCVWKRGLANALTSCIRTPALACGRIEDVARPAVR